MQKIIDLINKEFKERKNVGGNWESYEVEEYLEETRTSLINQIEAISVTRCCDKLKDKKAFTFEDWLYKHQIKKIDRLYFSKDGTEQEFNSLHCRYVQTLQDL